MTELPKYPRCEVCKWGISYGKVVCGDCAERLQDKNDQLLTRVTELEAENERLREALKSLWMASDIDGELTGQWHGGAYVVKMQPYLELMDERTRAEAALNKS